MDININELSSAPYVYEYKSMPFVSCFEFFPFKDGWYYVLVEEEGQIYGTYCEFIHGAWINTPGEVLYWMENY